MKDLKSITAITEVFPTGQKTVAAAVAYPKALDAASVTPAAFSVKDRTVVRAYAHEEPARSEKPTGGRYVVLELSPEDAGAATYVPMDFQRQIPPKVLPGSVLARQVAPLWTAEGETLAPWEEDRPNTDAQNLIVDDFAQGVWEGMPYNLFIPKEYDPTQAYPLVLFIHDAGVCGEDPRLTLVQGTGAVVWASPEEQAKRPCFILAPQFAPPPIVNDDFEADDRLGVAKRLLDHIVDSYAIDAARIYTTGQSMGCMSSCELMIRYPETFAAALLVAGQWSPERMAGLSGEKMWILVSQGDAKAFPGMNAVTGAMESAGIGVSRAFWDAKTDALEAEAWQQAVAPENVKYTVFSGKSVLPADTADTPGNCHICTWPIVYGIDAIRAWLFTNQRGQ